MSGQHARLSASSAHRWLRCPGSVATKGTDKPSIYAATGTFAHSIAAKCLLSGDSPHDYLLARDKVDGFSVECDLEMVEAIQVYLDFIAQDRQKGDETWVEMPLLEALQKIDPDLGGTADFVRYRPGHLHVMDFKFGSGTFVAADDNEQLKLYALGAMLTANRPVEDVTVTIVQPRFEGAAPIRSDTFKAVDILDFIADVQDAAVLTRDENAARVAGDHCKFCPQAKDCPKLEEKTHAVIALDFSAVTDYDPAKLSAGLAMIPLVKERIKAMEEFAYLEANAGRFGPEHGWKLVDKRPVRKWIDVEEVKKWALREGVDIWTEPEILSPAQVEKKLAETAPKGKKKDAGKALDPLVTKVSSGTALVPVADNRPSVKLVTADDFAVIDGTADK